MQYRLRKMIVFKNGKISPVMVLCAAVSFFLMILVITLHPSIMEKLYDKYSPIILRENPLTSSLPPYWLEYIPIKSYSNEEITEMILGKEKAAVFKKDRHNDSVEKFAPATFPYLINNENLCSAVSNLRFVLWVYSAPSDVASREMLRMTWAKPNLFPRYSTATVFFLGTTTDKEVMQNIVNENHIHMDIVQVDYAETYRRLPYKGIAALKWTTEFCQNADYVVKADSDVYVNMTRVMNIITDIDNRIHKTAMNDILAVGRVLRDSSVIRSNDPKFHIDTDILPGMIHYPPYMNGVVYILSNKAVPLLYQAAMKTPVIPVDDAFITGILPAQIPMFSMIDLDYKDYGKRPLHNRYLSDEANSLDTLFGYWCYGIHYLPFQNRSIC